MDPQLNRKEKDLISLVVKSCFLPQVSQINAMTDAEKREKQIVLKKLAEMEEELKVKKDFLQKLPLIDYLQLLALSENLTDQVRVKVFS